MSYGAQLKFGIARQSVEGTAVPIGSVSSYHPFPLLSEDVGLEKEEVVSANLNGRFEEGAVYDGVARVSGTIEFEMTPRGIGAALAAVVNHNPAVVTSGTVKAYTFLPNTADFSPTAVKAPWTIYKQWADATSAEQFYDCQFGQADFIFAQGQFAKGRIRLADGRRSPTGVGSMAIVALPSDVGYLWPWNVCSISIGGVGVGVMSEVTVSLNENIEPLYGLNSSLEKIKSTRTGFRQVEVSATFYMNDRTQLNDFVAGTQKRLLITAISTKTSIQSGYFDTLTLDVPQMKIRQFKPGTSGPGEVSVSMTGRGVVDPSSGYAFQAILTNTWAAGY